MWIRRENNPVDWEQFDITCDEKYSNKCKAEWGKTLTDEKMYDIKKRKI